MCRLIGWRWSATKRAFNSRFSATIYKSTNMPPEFMLSSSQREEKAQQIASALAYLRLEAACAGFADTASGLEDLEKRVIHEAQAIMFQYSGNDPTMRSN
jgi:hypothetical protein